MVAKRERCFHKVASLGLQPLCLLSLCCEPLLGFHYNCKYVTEGGIEQTFVR